MMVLHAYPAGNAIQLSIEPPVGALKWRVLRNTSGTFTGVDDPLPVVVSESNRHDFIDHEGLTNGTTYHYIVYYHDGTDWLVAADTGSVLADVNYESDNLDPQVLVRDRVEHGIKTELSRAALSAQSGKIQVLTAPPLFENTKWPVVTVHFDSGVPGEYAIGNFLGEELIDGEWHQEHGWLKRVTLTITGWANNPDTRIALRQALSRVLMANLELFESEGMEQIEFHISDSELFDQYPVAVYMTVTTLICLVPEYLITKLSSIEDVIVTSACEA